MEKIIYEDGIPACPKEVIEKTAFVVFQKAMKQSVRNLWEEPTEEQKLDFESIIQSFYNNYNVQNDINDLENEISELQKKLKEIKDKRNKESENMLLRANKLNLICERAKTKDDSYLLFYTKPGIDNYNGPFLMLREMNASNVVIVSPHDGFDRTSIDTKLAFKMSKSLAVVCNGHRKWSRYHDFSKNENRLGYDVLVKLASLVDKPIILNIHGMKNDKKILRRSRSDKLLRVFDNAVKEFTYLKDKKDVFRFNAHYIIDLIKTPYQLKTEIPVKIHSKNKEFIGNFIKKVEENTWAWSNDDLYVKLDTDTDYEDDYCEYIEEEDEEDEEDEEEDEEDEEEDEEELNEEELNK